MIKLVKLLTEAPNSNDFRNMYEKMDINLDNLGCIMLDIDSDEIPSLPEEFEDEVYFTKNPDRYWIKGFVGSSPHCTLLYGLMESGKKNKKYVDKVLDGWSIDTVEVESIGFFDSPFSDDPYFCIIAHLKITDDLKEGRSRLELLPHINTYPDFKAHVTIAYIKKDESVKKKIINFYKDKLIGKKLSVTKLNYGK